MCTSHWALTGHAVQPVGCLAGPSERHLHFRGVSAEDVAAIVSRVGSKDR